MTSVRINIADHVDIVRFVEHHVKLLSDPVFGGIQTPVKRMYVKGDVSMVKPNVRRENFATNVCAVNNFYFFNNS